MKSSRRLQRLAGAVERQDAAVVGQRMQHDGDVLARLHDLVEIADAAVTDGVGQRSVGPHRLAALEQIAAREVGGGEVVVAGDRLQRQAEPRRHMGDEAGLAATGRALQQHGKAQAIRVLEQRAFAALRRVERDLGFDDSSAAGAS